MNALTVTISTILAGAILAVLVLRFRYQILRGIMLLISLAISLLLFAGAMYLALTPPWQYVLLLVVGAILGGAIYIDCKREAKRKEAERIAQEIRAWRAEHGIKLPYSP